MIEMSELLKKTKLEDLPSDIQDNLTDLVERLNVIRRAYGKPMTVSSGFRTKEDHLRVYREKGITDPKKIPMGSRHLSGKACDIADSDGKLKDWVNDNVELCEKVELWMEDFSATPTWIHFQSEPPASKKRFFMPG